MRELYLTLITCVLSLMSWCVPGIVPVNAQMVSDTNEIVLSPNPVAIPIGREVPLKIYFPYAAPQATTLEKAVLRVEVTGTGFTLDANGMSDSYHPESNPKAADCTKPADIPSYSISPTLISGGMLVYGPQSAQQVDSASGTSSSRLRAGATGCLGVSIKVSPEGQVGNRVRVALVMGYEINAVPSELPATVYYLELIANNSPECGPEEELVAGTCQPACRLGTIRTVQGTCVDVAELNTNSQDVIGVGSNQTQERIGEANGVRFRFITWVLWITLGALVIAIGLLLFTIRMYILYTPESKRNFLTIKKK